MSIIVISEIDNGRGTVVRWLERVTKWVRDSSNNVLVLLFSYDREQNLSNYNKIDPRMSVMCIRWSIQDEENVDTLTRKLIDYHLALTTLI